MTRKPTRKGQIAAVLSALMTLVALAPMTSTGQAVGQASATAETSSSAQALQPLLLPGVLNTQAVPGSLGQRRKSGAVPFDSGFSLFLPVATYTFPGATDPYSIAVADLNGDGKLDLAISNLCNNPACNSNGAVGVLLGNGDGTFVQGGIYDSGGAGAYSVAVGDLNRDGKPDLVVMNRSSGVGVLLGNGDGTFQPVVTYGVGSNLAWQLALGDVNGDGNPDIVLAICATFCSPPGSLAIMLGNGDGTFQPMVTYDVGTTAGSTLALGDVNGDGNADILVMLCLTSPCSGKGAVGVLLGNGDGTFKPAVTYASGYGSGALVIADVNGDGTPDVVVTSCLSSTCSEGAVGVLLGNGDGTFQPVATYDSGGYDATTVAVADVNGDGKPDLVVGDCSGKPGGCGSVAPGAVGVLLGNGDGTFQSVITYYSGGNGLRTVAVADLNGDGRPDVVAGNYWPGSIGVLLNDTAGRSATTTTLSSSPNPSVFGQVAMFTATVSSASGVPSGTVIFHEGTTDLGSATLVSGRASISVSSLSARSHSIVASYQGASTFQGSNSAVVNQVVHGFTTTTMLASSPNPSMFAQAVTFTATVSSASGAPTGTVVFYDATITLGSASLLSGSASISVSLLSPGSHSITAAYQGFGAFEPGTSAALNQVVNQATTTTSVASSKNPVVLFRDVIYTATVISQFGGTVTGTVTFWDGGRKLGTRKLSGNQAAWVRLYQSPIAIGFHSITAVYSGDANNAGSTSPRFIEDVKYPSYTAVTPSVPTSLIGQPVTFSVTVKSTNVFGNPLMIPNGEHVTFSEGPTTLASVALSNGMASYTTSLLSLGDHSIRVTYPGDATFGPSAGWGKPVKVTKYPTRTVLISSLNSSNYGQPVTLTTTVTSAGPAPTGWVIFKSGSMTLGSKPLNASGVATLTTAKIPVGANTLTSTYTGDASNGKSVSAAIPQTVSQALIRMVLTSTPNPSTFGKLFRFTATLTSNGGLPSGQLVNFSYNNATLGAAYVNHNGVVTFYNITLPRGSDVVTATYAGTEDYSSALATVTQVVN